MAEWDALTKEFQRDVEPFETISAGTERHGSWEWTAVKRDQLNRFVVLSLTRLGPTLQPEPWFGPWFDYEITAGADDGARFLRRLMFQFSGPVPDMKLEQLSIALRQALRRAMEYVIEVQPPDLDESIPRPTFQAE